MTSPSWREQTLATGQWTKADRRVIVEVARLAHKTGTLFATVATLAALTGCGARTIHRTLRRLEELGAVERQQRPGQATTYTLRPLPEPLPEPLPNGRPYLCHLADPTSAKWQTPSAIAEHKMADNNYLETTTTLSSLYKDDSLTGEAEDERQIDCDAGVVDRPYAGRRHPFRPPFMVDPWMPSEAAWRHVCDHADGSVDPDTFLDRFRFDATTPTNSRFVQWFAKDEQQAAVERQRYLCLLDEGENNSRLRNHPNKMIRMANQ